jgi:hypothetical protein
MLPANPSWNYSVSTERGKWENLGDGLDSKREVEKGPISAEGNFTIMDLLAHMGLWGPYEYYHKGQTLISYSLVPF